MFNELCSFYYYPFVDIKLTTKSAFLERQLPIEHSDINENACQGRLCVVQ